MERERKVITVECFKDEQRAIVSVWGSDEDLLKEFNRIEIQGESNQAIDETPTPEIDFSDVYIAAISQVKGFADLYSQEEIQKIILSGFYKTKESSTFFPEELETYRDLVTTTESINVNHLRYLLRD
jgi:hypothetical protein